MPGLGKLFDAGEEPGELVERYNALQEPARRAALAGWLRDAFLSDAALRAGKGPWEARQFIEWLEEAGGWITPPVTVFEVAGRSYETTDPASVLEWLRDNLPEAAFAMQESGSGMMKRYRLTMGDGDAVLFRTRWG